MTILGPPSSKRSWSLVGFYLAAIYGSLPFARGVAVALQQKHLFGAFVTLLYFISAVGVVYYVIFDVRLSDRIAFLALVVLTASTGSLILGISIPEERIHFLEYGIFALLARRALSWHRPPIQQYWGALCLASAAGLGDELIQIPLPDRYFGIRDVVINAVAAFLALAADEVLHNRLGWLPRKTEEREGE